MISLVAKGLPNLVDVRFTSTDSLDMECCPNCYEDSLTRISHSPVSDLYSDVIVLAVSFGYPKTSEYMQCFFVLHRVSSL